MAGKTVSAPRIAAVWCPDWPVAAAAALEDVSAHIPAAVVHANEILACSAIARAEGVRRGMRRRQAQSICPELVVFPYDPDRDARAFEPVVSAVEELAPGVEVLRPGLCVFAARGPARYFGGDEAVAELLLDHVAQQCQVEAMVGIAEGTFAASLAARVGTIVPPGHSEGFLAVLPIGVLDRPDMVDLMRRLGIRTLGAFAALPPRDVLARFGPEGAKLHRLARGQQDRPVTARTPPTEIAVVSHPDPPIERVDTAAFAARMLAEQLRELLASHGLACTRLGIDAETSNGEQLTRVWRHDGALSASDIADRTRWQLDGWLTGRTRTDRPSAGISRLRLVAEEVIDDGGLQLGLWGEMGDGSGRAFRALTHLHGILGQHGLLTPVLGGGREFRDQVRSVPWRDDRTPTLPADQPWPGHPGPPSPSLVLPHSQRATVTDHCGAPVTVNELSMTSAPRHVAVANRPIRTVVSWINPWPVDPLSEATFMKDRRVRIQVVLAATDNEAEGPWLLIAERDHWLLEAAYY